MLVIPAFTKMRQEFEFKTTGLHSEDLSQERKMAQRVRILAVEVGRPEFGS